MKRELKNIIPFNNFWLKSCFYHAFLVVAQYYGGDPLNYIKNQFIHYQNKDGRFSVVNGGFIHYTKVEGIKEHRRKKEKNLIKAIKSKIDRDLPVILALDSFYLPFRNDTYLKKHIVHYVCVYGYDEEERQLFLVDHEYWGSYKFEKKTLPMRWLVKAYHEYVKENPEKFTFFWYTKDGEKQLINYAQRYQKDQRLLRAYLNMLKEQIANESLEVESVRTLFGQLSWIHTAQCYMLQVNGKMEVYNAINNFVNQVRMIWAELTRIQNFGFKPEKKEKLIGYLEHLYLLQVTMDGEMEKEQKLWTSL